MLETVWLLAIAAILYWPADITEDGTYLGHDLQFILVAIDTRAWPVILEIELNDVHVYVSIYMMTVDISSSVDEDDVHELYQWYRWDGDEASHQWVSLINTPSQSSSSGAGTATSASSTRYSIHQRYITRLGFSSWGFYILSIEKLVRTRSSCGIEISSRRHFQGHVFWRFITWNTLWSRIALSNIYGWCMWDDE